MLPPSRSETTSAGRRRLALLLAAVTVLAVAVVAIWSLLFRDPYRPGTTRTVQLVHTQPECAYWMVQPDPDHGWRNTEDVPATWTSPKEGTLEVTDADHATFTADGQEIDLWGGNLRTDPPKAFTSDCPASLSP